MEMAKEILPASADEITTTRVAFGLMAVVTNKENEKALALKEKDSVTVLALQDKDAAFALEKQRMETISTQIEAIRMKELSSLSQRYEHPCDCFCVTAACSVVLNELFCHTLGVTRFYIERLFRSIIHAYSQNEGAIFNAIQSNNTNSIVKDFQLEAAKVKNPSMTAVDRLLTVPAVKDAVWEVSCIAHRCVPPLSDRSRLQDLKIPSDVKYPSRFPDALTYGVLSDEVYTLAAQSDVGVSFAYWKHIQLG
jgi:hypothetical protein